MSTPDGKVKMEYGPSALGHFFLQTPTVTLEIYSAESAARIGEALLQWASKKLKEERA